MGEGERMPKLEEVFKLTSGTLIQLNIEVKAPHDRETRALYNFRECTRKVHELVVRFGIQDKCYVSSFDNDVLAELESLN